MMITFLMIFAVAIISLLAVQAMDVESGHARGTRRRVIFARKMRVPFRMPFRNVLGGAAR